ncbi:MAG: polysaccharide lyase [Oligoflexia bacterium]|nr:polysaccharide lyase [Oligoflexia bacterium]
MKKNILNFFALSFIFLSLSAFGFFGDGVTRKFGFDYGNFSGLSTERLAGPNGARIITGPTRHGTHAVAITLPPGLGFDNSYKSELSDNFHADYGKEIWYRVSHFFPASFKPNRNNKCTLAQWHNASVPGYAGGRPPLANRFKNGTFYITVNYSYKQVMDPLESTNIVIAKIPNFKYLQWHDFVYRVLWSVDDRGEVDVWHNGKKIASYRGPIGYRGDVAGPYFKMGVYCDEGSNRSLTVYADEYRRGKTAKDILIIGENLE